MCSEEHIKSPKHEHGVRLCSEEHVKGPKHKHDVNSLSDPIGLKGYPGDIHVHHGSIPATCSVVIFPRKYERKVEEMETRARELSACHGER
ncbi:hypothetical protein NPIL_307251 [Nephila pilipes]|uniref:Uncharacterized protein n=1 Tax=Nephila pilipes TaxID=299642 RepID=A0A8X6IZG7_NEPPI|nr:hypothetical protein NPIL_307251 [Nephila pilipes]